ncbi:hypothetical protein ACTUTK_00555 [Pantoea ananatis]|uniref:hypothetical protein n=1 Tax=Pantoea ananas TaxID=553 RepID=UPI00105A4BA6|nr:hypothetical protein [Pantoea ananatis]TDL50733.1 hypothetical protein E2R52_17345 [Pantoea ananatis]
MKFKNPFSGINGEYWTLSIIFFVILILSFGLIYAFAGEQFEDANKSLLILIEIGSGTCAICIFAAERAGAMEKAPKAIKSLTNILTLIFFALTLPHLVYGNLKYALSHPQIANSILLSAYLIVIACFYYALSLKYPHKLWVNLILSLIATSLISYAIYESANSGTTEVIIEACKRILNKIGITT